jgi:amidohydrolase
MNISPEVLALQSDLVALRRDFHRHPELGYRETRTSGIVAERLRKAGYAVRTGIAKTGVIGVLRGGRPGKTLLLRADMDALPVQEENRTAYASVVPGVMHACGHDGHTAIGLVAAQVLASRRAKLAGTILFVFQPAEEELGGAPAMIKEGLLENPAPDAALALHLWNSLPVGSVGVRAGATWASSDRMEIAILGRGGHAGYPHTTIDPVVIAAETVLALQTIVSRELPPTLPAALSVTRIAGGATTNVIPSEVVMQGTMRLYEESLRGEVKRRIERVVKGVAEAHGAGWRVRFDDGYPVTVNDARHVALIREVAAGVVGAARVVEHEATMGSEDMGYIFQRVPGCYFMLGSMNAAKGLCQPHHHPRFDFDEACLPVGVEILVRAAERILGGAAAEPSHGRPRTTTGRGARRPRKG